MHSCVNGVADHTSEITLLDNGLKMKALVFIPKDGVNKPHCFFIPTIIFPAS
jgi:hypothetical protein